MTFPGFFKNTFKMEPARPEQTQDTHKHDYIALCVNNLKKYKRMKTQIILWSCIFLAGITSVSAQFSETIVSDRPGQSNSPYTVGKMVLQFQTGPQFDGADADNYKNNSFSWPAFVRFGITDKIEVQTLWSYQSENTEEYIFDSKRNGLNAADFGLRFNIFEETDKAPALGFEVLYKTKLKSDDYQPDHSSAKINFMSSKTLSDLLSLTANLGVDYDGDGGAPTGLYTLNLVFVVKEELSVFFENYGNFGRDDFNTYFDFGGAYLLNPNLQLDLYGGFGYNNDTFTYLVSSGISYRIIKWKKD